MAQEGMENKELSTTIRETDVEDDEPTLMYYEDARAAADISFLSNTSDPLQHYLVDTPDNVGLAKRRAEITRKMHYSMAWCKAVYQRCAWTVCHDSARAYMMMFNAVPSEKKRPLHDTMDALYPWLSKALDSFATPEQRKRRQEFSDKFFASSGSFHTGRPMSIAALVANSSACNKGRRELVSCGAALADAQNCPLSVLSTNSKDTGFYQKMGFVVLRAITLGAENPAWKESPVSIDVMIRTIKHS